MTFETLDRANDLVEKIKDITEDIRMVPFNIDDMDSRYFDVTIHDANTGRSARIKLNGYNLHSIREHLETQRDLLSAKFQKL